MVSNRSSSTKKTNGATSRSSSSGATCSTASRNGTGSSSSANGTSSGKSPAEAAPEEAASSSEYRQLVVQEQVRSLRRRLWHAFQREDARTALRAYTATAKDLQDWVRQEIHDAKKREAQRQLKEKEKKDSQRPTMMKRLSLPTVVTGAHKNSSSNGPKGKQNNMNLGGKRRTSTTTTGTTTTKESFFSKLKKPPPVAAIPDATNDTGPTEYELIMSPTNNDNNALLPIHINPSEPFLLDDYKDPLFEIDPTTGEPRSVASMTDDGNPSSTTAKAGGEHLHMSSSGRHFKPFRKQKSRTPQQPQQPRTATSSFWASLKLLEGRRTGTGREGPTAVASDDPSEILTTIEPSESTAHPDFAGAANDFQTVALTDSKMTTPLHEAARLGNAEILRLILAHPFAEPNFKNGHRRTVLHMVAGGWTEPEERLWRTRQHKIETKLNHKKKQQQQQGGAASSSSPKIGSSRAQNANVGVPAPVPIQIGSSDGSDQNGNSNSGMVGAKKAARAMSRFFQTTFATNSKDSGDSKAGTKKAPATEPQGYLVWDEQVWNKLKTERMDCLLAILSWCHPQDGTNSAGEGASVNAVDAQGRTALHYAAELGREDVCMAVLSSFGAMLTVVDDSARTPCELAAEQNHPELAAQLEARALLYSDPYGMDDELLAAVMAEQQTLEVDDVDVGEGADAEIVKARMALSAPFCWFRTSKMEDVEKERTKRLADCSIAMMAFVQKQQEENELRKVMYGMKDDDVGGFSESVFSDSNNDKGDKTTENSAPVSATVNNSDYPKKKTAAKKKGMAAGGSGGSDISSESNESEDDWLDSRNTEGEDTGWESGEADGEQNANKSVGSVDPPGLAQSAAPEQAEARTGTEKAAGKLKDDPPGEEKTSASEAKTDTATTPLKSKQEGKTLTDEDLSALKSIQTAHVAQYLSRHGWIVDKALAAFTDNPIKALEEAGVPLHEVYRAQQRAAVKSKDANEDSISSNVCLICFDEFDISDSENWTHLVNCSHSFCNSCLGDYLVDCAKSRSTGISVPCPHHECIVPMAQPEIKKLTPSDDIYLMLQNTANDNFVASATDVRFCPHPGCSGIVKVIITETMKKWLYQQDHFTSVGAVCTADHENVKVDVTNVNQIPMTYDGMIDPRCMNARCKTPPKSAHRFCFGCGESKFHFPVSCDVLEDWNRKMMNEIEQLKEDGDSPESDENYGDIAQRLWMKANTRPCPKCKAPIEKNEGCNHVTCQNSSCKHEFCWICRKDWKLHNTATGGFFRCNRWQDEDNHDFYDSPPPPDQLPRGVSAADATNDEIMNNPEVMAQTYGTAMHETRTAWRKSKEMKRFLHHYTRWNAHMESAELEKMMSETVCERLAPVVDAAAEFMCDAKYNFDGKGLSFVHAAFKELLECRSVLQHSYAYSFFKFEILAVKRHRHGKRLWNEKAAFEQMQSELEMITEQMSDIVARSHLRATQTQILFLTAGASERRREFSNVIFTLMSEEWKRQKEADNKASNNRNDSSVPLSTTLENGNLSTLVVQGIASGIQEHVSNNDETEPQNQQQMTQETVREALLASLEAFMANTDDQPTFVARVERNFDEDTSDVDVDDDFNDDDDGEDDDDQYRSWACSACTYMNTSGRHCAMCGTPVGA